jgi:hypothetical protein
MNKKRIVHHHYLSCNLIWIIRWWICSNILALALISNRINRMYWILDNKWIKTNITLYQINLLINYLKKSLKFLLLMSNQCY